MELYRRIDVPVVEPEPVVPKPNPPAIPEPPNEPGPGQNPGTEPGTGPGQNPGTEPGTGPGQNPGTEPGTGPGQDPGPAPIQPDPNKPNQPDDFDDTSGLPKDSDDPEAPICKRTGDCEPDSGSKAINHQNRAGPDITYDSKFQESYQVKDPEKPVPISDRVLKKFGKDNNIDFDDQYWKQFEVWSKTGTQATSDAFYSAENNAMFAFRRFSQNDETEQGKRVPSAELQWQKMKEIKGDKIGDLEWVGDIYITNRETQDRIKTANNKKGKKNTWAKYTSEDDAWKDLADTDNAKGYFYMLGDHHEELRGLKVKEMYAFDGSKGYLFLKLGRD